MNKAILKCFQFKTQDDRPVATSFVTALELKRYITDNLPPELHALMLSDANGDERLKTKVIKFLKDNESTYRISYLNGSGNAFQTLSDLGIAKAKELGIRNSADTVKNWLMLIPTYVAMQFIKSYAPIFIEKMEVDVPVTGWIEFEDAPETPVKQGIISVNPDFIYQVGLDLDKLKAEMKMKRVRKPKERVINHEGFITYLDGKLNLTAHLVSFLNTDYINIGIITGRVGAKGILVVSPATEEYYNFALYKRKGSPSTTFTIPLQLLCKVLEMDGIPARGKFNAIYNPEKNVIEIDFNKPMSMEKGVK